MIIKCEKCGNTYILPKNRQPKMETPCWDCGHNICEKTWDFVRDAFKRVKGDE